MTLGSSAWARHPSASAGRLFLQHNSSLVTNVDFSIVQDPQKTSAKIPFTYEGDPPIIHRATTIDRNPTLCFYSLRRLGSPAIFYIELTFRIAFSIFQFVGESGVKARALTLLVLDLSFVTSRSRHPSQRCLKNVSQQRSTALERYFVYLLRTTPVSTDISFCLIEYLSHAAAFSLVNRKSFLIGLGLSTSKETPRVRTDHTIRYAGKFSEGARHTE
jgi:hypothetical protein